MGIYRQYALGWNYSQFGVLTEQLLQLTHNSSVRKWLETPLDGEILPADCASVASGLESVLNHPAIVEHKPALSAIAQQMRICASENQPFLVK